MRSRRPVTTLGKVGNVVYGRNRHGQTVYQLVIPTNPRTAPQQANRGKFGAASADWRRRTEAQREAWNLEGPKHRSRKRLGQSGPLSGYNYFVQVNAKRVARGLPLLEWPPGRKAEGGRGSVGAGERGALERAGGGLRGGGTPSLGFGVGSGGEACGYGVATVALRYCYGILSDRQRWREGGGLGVRLKAKG